MSKDSEIPCSACRKWNSTAKSFSCNPNECQKLTDWLLGHAQLGHAETKQAAKVPIQYVV